MAAKVGDKTEFDFIVVGGSSSPFPFKFHVFCLNAMILIDWH
jgi:hypothetical protein